MVDSLSATFRALSFIALFQAAGMAIFFALFGRLLTISAETLRRTGLASALCAVVFVIAQYVLEAARLTGELAGVFDASMQALVLHSPTATGFAWRLSGLLLLVAAFHTRTSTRVVPGLIGAMLIAGSFAFVGHTASDPQRWILSLLLLAHLLIVAFWFGALVPLYVASRRESAQSAGDLTESFSRVALYIVPLLLFAGLVLAAMILKAPAALRTTYGQLLIVKLLGFASLMGLAALNKWRLGPRLASGDVGLHIAFRRALAAEYLLIAAILSLTAALTSFYSPE
jgi:copper resistance protein D